MQIQRLRRMYRAYLAISVNVAQSMLLVAVKSHQLQELLRQSSRQTLTWVGSVTKP